MAKNAIAVVAVATNLIGAIVEPMHGPEHGWPVALRQPNLSDEVFAEVVAVFVGDLDEGGALKLVCRANMTGALAEVYAAHVKVRRPAVS